jgi:hypothetical protein
MRNSTVLAYLIRKEKTYKKPEFTVKNDTIHILLIILPFNIFRCKSQENDISIIRHLSN